MNALKREAKNSDTFFNLLAVYASFNAQYVLFFVELEGEFQNNDAWNAYGRIWNYYVEGCGARNPGHALAFFVSDTLVVPILEMPKAASN